MCVCARAFKTTTRIFFLNTICLNLIDLSFSNIFVCDLQSSSGRKTAIATIMPESDISETIKFSFDFPSCTCVRITPIMCVVRSAIGVFRKYLSPTTKIRKSNRKLFAYWPHIRVVVESRSAIRSVTRVFFYRKISKPLWAKKNVVIEKKNP